MTETIKNLSETLKTLSEKVNDVPEIPIMQYYFQNATAAITMAIDYCIAYEKSQEVKNENAN